MTDILVHETDRGISSYKLTVCSLSWMTPELPLYFEVDNVHRFTDDPSSLRRRHTVHEFPSALFLVPELEFDRRDGPVVLPRCREIDVWISVLRTGIEDDAATDQTFETTHAEIVYLRRGCSASREMTWPTASGITVWIDQSPRAAS